jgi:uncharacterized protein
MALKRRVGIFIAFFILFAAPAAFAEPSAGVALLIGNAAYPDADASLKEPVTDGHALGDELRRRGFDVDVEENLSKEAMQRALDRFYAKIKPGSTAVFFFSGFGIQSDRQNYLIPVNARIWSEPEVRLDGYSIEKILDEMNARGARVKIAILDASRRNPYERRFRKTAAGLAAITSPRGSLVMTSAAPGSIVSEDSPPVFMSQLLQEAQKPDSTVEQIFNRTRMDVLRATQSGQVPWFSSSLDEDFVFTSASGAAPGPPEVRQAETPPPAAPSATLQRRTATEQPASTAQAGGRTLHSDPVTDCDRLAADNSDEQRPPSVAGVVEQQIDTKAALQACNEAAREYPDVARFVFQTGRVAHAQKDYATALLLFEKAADMGSKISITDMGGIYLFGQGVTKDYAKARGLFEKAQAKGDHLAVALLGMVYHNGWGVGQDYTQARQFYEKAAAAGEPLAMRNLGNLYANGLGVPKDYSVARRWYEKAAAAGSPEATSNLGLFYQNGLGGPQDYTKARQFYEKAVAAGDTEAMNRLGFLYEKGLGVPENYGLAREWYGKGAAAGNVPATRNLGLLYQNGSGGAQDYAEARQLYEKAAAAGSAIAMNDLGLVYERGLGVAKDFSQARQWYEKGAAAGNALAVRNLGLFYQNGWGGPQDYSQARQLYEKAAAAGNAEAMNDLGLLYEKGLGVAKDSAQARQWFEKAAAAGNEYAKANFQRLNGAQ